MREASAARKVKEKGAPGRVGATTYAFHQGIADLKIGHYTGLGGRGTIFG